MKSLKLMIKGEELLQETSLSWDTISMNWYMIMIRALATYAFKYNSEMHRQLLHFDNIIQTMSFQYAWTFIKKCVKKVV